MPSRQPSAVHNPTIFTACYYLLIRCMTWPRQSFTALHSPLVTWCTSIVTATNLVPLMVHGASYHVKKSECCKVSINTSPSLPQSSSSTHFDINEDKDAHITIPTDTSHSFHSWVASVPERSWYVASTRHISDTSTLSAPLSPHRCTTLRTTGMFCLLFLQGKGKESYTIRHCCCVNSLYCFVRCMHHGKWTLYL